jgi:inhibitor of cysteine peptidase
VTKLLRTYSWSGLLAVAVAAVLVSASCGDDGGAPNKVQLGEADNGHTVTVAKGGTVIVALPSNPSTGFSWAVIPPQPAQLELHGEPKYVPTVSTTPVVGAGGTEILTFEAKSTGTATLRLGYARPFEPGVPPEKTFEVTVTVE